MTATAVSRVTTTEVCASGLACGECPLHKSAGAVVGSARTTPIQILLQGTELDFAWTVVLDKDDGTITVTLVNRDDAFLLFGACTPD
jgi:hypothetical protein